MPKTGKIIKTCYKTRFIFRCQSRKKSVISKFFEKKFERKMESAKNGKIIQNLLQNRALAPKQKKYDFEVCLKGIWKGQWKVTKSEKTPKPFIHRRFNTLTFFPRKSERRVLLKVEARYTSSHAQVFTSSHVQILITYSQTHTFTSSYLHTHSHLHIFSSSHLHILTSAPFTHLSLSRSSPSHLHIFLPSHTYIFTSSHLHIFTSSLSVSFSFSSLSLSFSLSPSVSLSLSSLSRSLSFFLFSLLRQQAVPTRRHNMATRSHEMRFGCQN